MSLGGSFVRAVRWSALSQGLAQLAQYGSFVLLARLLSPHELGTLASAMLVVGLAGLLNECGMGAALIQRGRLAPGHLSACFWTNMAIGVAVWGVLCATASLVAGFFRNPAIGGVLPVVALGFLAVAAGVLPKALLEKSLRFKALGLIEAAGAFASGGLAIALALAGFGLWSMVYGSLVGFLLQSTAYWLVARPRVGLRFSRAEFGDLFGFGANVLGSRMLAYWMANVDYLIIGRMMGPAALGVYSLAYKLVTWPMLKISHVVLRVAYPALSRLQGDEAAFRRQYTQLAGHLALVVLPVLVALAILAEPLIGFAFGPAWHQAVLPTQLLCGVGALKALTCSVGVVFLTKGRPELELRLNLLGAIKLPIFLVAGVHGGMTGVATALLLSNLTGAPLQQHIANRLIGLKWRSYCRALGPAAAASAGVGLPLAGWCWLGRHWGELALLLGAAPLATAGALVALTLVGYDWRRLLRSVAGRRATVAPGGA